MSNDKKSRPLPLAPATIDAFLQFLVPPSKLPAQLVSLPLLQRHHFLQITPENNLADYLIWPCDEQAGILKILTTSSPVSAKEFQIRYSGDHQSLYAHVYLRFTLEESLRLVFLWDGPGNAWKYHNVALMPFPTQSYDRLDVAWEQQHPVVRVEETGEDDYWNAYGNDDDDNEQDEHGSVSSTKPETANTEDAYWAQYSNVHGSGDSTIPSPVPEKRKPGAYNSSHVDEPSLPSSLGPSQHATDLSDRLYALSLGSPDAQEGMQEHVASNADSSTPSDVTPIVSSETKADDALTDAIRGVYGLWKMGHGQAAGVDKFLGLVKHAIVND